MNVRAPSLLIAALAAAAVLAACEQAPFPSLGAGQSGAGGQGAGGAAGGLAGAAGKAPGDPDPLLVAYPTAGDFFTRAVVPSCGDELACHGGRASPLLRTFADLEATFGAPCQRTVADPRALVDLCEIAGDDVAFGAGLPTRRILTIDVAPSEPSPPLRVTLKLDGPVPTTLAETLLITRSPRDSGPAQPSSPSPSPSPSPPPSPIELPATTVAERFGSTLVLDLAGLDGSVRTLFDERVYPRKSDSVQVWDPNRNGVVGASSGGRLAVRGDVRRSYLYLRLLNDDLGSRMPLLPGSWSSSETRAMGCFLRSPVAAGAALDLTDCPEDPAAPGQSKLAALLGTQCASSGCHDDTERAGALSLVPDDGLPARLRGVYATQLRSRLLVDPQAPDTSYLMCKITPGCEERAFDPMPQGRAALSDEERAIVRAWIAADLPVP